MRNRGTKKLRNLSSVTRQSQDSTPSSLAQESVLLITMPYCLSSVLSVKQFHTSMPLPMLFLLIFKTQTQGHLIVKLALASPLTFLFDSVIYSFVTLSAFITTNFTLNHEYLSGTECNLIILAS